MNSLQLGLIAVGVLIVAALALVYGWQMWRAGRPSPSVAPSDARSRSEAERRDEPRVEPRIAPRAEPTMQVSSEDASDEPASSAPVAIERISGVATPSPGASPDLVRGSAPAVAVSAGSGAEAPAPAANPGAGGASMSRPSRVVSELPFDQRLHVYASIVSVDGSPFDAQPLVLAAGRARAWVRLFRQSPLDEFDPDSTASVQQVILALPLASRAGPLAQADLDAWQFSVAQAVREMDGEVHFHGLEDAATRAAELDQFLAAVDIMPHVYLVKDDPTGWAGTRLRSTLEANGFRLQSDGRFAYYEVETDQVIFHAVDGYERPFTPERLRTEYIKALRFVLQPVNLAQPLARFDTYRQTLRALAKLLDGELRMTDGTVVDDAAFAALREDVKQAMSALSQAGIEPGSDTARSLFT